MRNTLIVGFVLIVLGVVGIIYTQDKTSPPAPQSPAEQQQSVVQQRNLLKEYGPYIQTLSVGCLCAGGGIWFGFILIGMFQTKAPWIGAILFMLLILAAEVLPATAPQVNLQVHEWLSIRLGLVSLLGISGISAVLSAGKAK